MCRLGSVVVELQQTWTFYVKLFSPDALVSPAAQ